MHHKGTFYANAEPHMGSIYVKNVTMQEKWTEQRVKRTLITILLSFSLWLALPQFFLQPQMFRISQFHHSDTSHHGSVFLATQWREKVKFENRFHCSDEVKAHINVNRRMWNAGARKNFMRRNKNAVSSSFDQMKSSTRSIHNWFNLSLLSNYFIPLTLFLWTFSDSIKLREI